MKCGSPTKSCRGCSRRYAKSEKELATCPQCGCERACATTQLLPNGRCRMHGGTSRKGLNHPGLKHGQSSRYLGVLSPQNQKLYTERLLDPDLLSLRQEIALLDMRLEILGKRVQRGQDDPPWDEALKKFEAFTSAHGGNDQAACAAAQDALADVLRRGARAEQTWRQIDELAWKRRPRLVEKQIRMGVQVAQMVQRGVVIQLLRVLAESVKRNVPDPKIIDIITGDILRLASAAISQPDGGVGELSEAADSTGD